MAPEVDKDETHAAVNAGESAVQSERERSSQVVDTPDLRRSRRAAKAREEWRVWREQCWTVTKAYSLVRRRHAKLRLLQLFSSPSVLILCVVCNEEGGARRLKLRDGWNRYKNLKIKRASGINL